MVTLPHLVGPWSLVPQASADQLDLTDFPINASLTTTHVQIVLKAH